MKTTEFNLEAALAGKPVVTRAGSKVDEIYHFKIAINSKQPVTAVLHGVQGEFSVKGEYNLGGLSSNFDLFMLDESEDEPEILIEAGTDGGLYTVLPDGNRRLGTSLNPGTYKLIKVK